ncbi:ArsR/SmtB family transcription factor [Luteibaculum oceani]|uniref:Winged helix-turn-helix transcriptional regulator n=1 Tax=Luteibaculum oceani TaxID=1294296 RepID=A0A5C6V1C4_9FLAO|nr:metalloregulator ArsR/SmtB family transcription factor [Luteibaculum oceani]TXC77108.1 winged helix-turn-helix transcriptional regulator [Luteibaculum oceani]
MGASKDILFSDQQNQLATAAKALSHPARIAILQHLFLHKTCINNELVNDLGLAQATVSQHLKELKALGIIKDTITGKKICYCIDLENWNAFKEKFKLLFDQNNLTNNCCNDTK